MLEAKNVFDSNLDTILVSMSRPCACWQAELANGVKILWDGRTRVYVTAPGSMMHHTQGLCGTFDNNQNNDLLTREQIVETNANRFGNSWKTQVRFLFSTHFNVV
jgi:hypothetical protein